MKTVTLTISDDSKFSLLINLLRELRFVSIEEETPVKKNKVMNSISKLVLRPAKAENFKMFSREELYASFEVLDSAL